MILPQLLRGVALVRAVGLAVIIPLACLLIDSSIAFSTEPAFALAAGSSQGVAVESQPALASEAALASEPVTGQELFQQQCVGCHLNGGNIIRRGRTLKLAALERNQLNNQEAIARIARDGMGQMSGYESALGEDGDQLVAAWILEQARDSWPH